MCQKKYEIDKKSNLQVHWFLETEISLIDSDIQLLYEKSILYYLITQFYNKILSVDHVTTCCETKKLNENTDGTTLTWKGSNLGKCKNALFSSDINEIKYRIVADNEQNVCMKNVKFKFKSRKNKIITFEKSSKCCKTNHENDKIYSAINMAIQTGKSTINNL